MLLAIVGNLLCLRCVLDDDPLSGRNADRREAIARRREKITAEAARKASAPRNGRSRYCSKLGIVPDHDSAPHP